MAEPTIAVEVIHVDAAMQVERRRVELPVGSSVMQAIEVSGMAPALSADAIDSARLGIFGRKVTANQLLRDGDRVEIYRPLVQDPKDARRRRTR